MKTVLAATIILPVATLWMITHSSYQQTDPNVAIKKRLRDFIALTESIDFDAKIKNQAARLELIAARDNARALLSELV